MRRQSGFTLIEIAIGAVDHRPAPGRGAEGPGADHQRPGANLISQQDGVKAAYFGFLDRFRALPGDYTQAGQHRQRYSGLQWNEGMVRLQTFQTGMVY